MGLEGWRRVDSEGLEVKLSLEEYKFQPSSKYSERVVPQRQTQSEKRQFIRPKNLEIKPCMSDLFCKVCLENLNVFI